MAFISSNNITVFPSTQRRDTQITARLITEQYLTNIINTLIDSDGFIITEDKGFNLSKPFEFNLHGYYFNVTSANAITNLFTGATANSYIFANIILDKDGDFIELDGQDLNGQYDGVFFTDAPIAETILQNLEKILGKSVQSFYLPLFIYKDNTWKIVDTSRIKFRQTSVQTSVDGGVIE